MQTKHFESIFDHGVTPEEFSRILRDSPELAKETDYLDKIGHNESWLFYHIGLLYELRGDYDKANIYMKLSDMPVSEIIDYCY